MTSLSSLHIHPFWLVFAVKGKKTERRVYEVQTLTHVTSYFCYPGKWVKYTTTTLDTVVLWWFQLIHSPKIPHFFCFSGHYFKCLVSEVLQLCPRWYHCSFFHALQHQLGILTKSTYRDSPENLLWNLERRSRKIVNWSIKWLTNDLFSTACSDKAWNPCITYRGGLVVSERSYPPTVNHLPLPVRQFVTGQWLITLKGQP